MTDNKMEANAQIIVSSILCGLENRLFLLRNDLSETKGAENLTEKFIAKTSSIMDEGNELTVYPATVEYILVLDCCDIEAAIHRVFSELVESGTFETLKEVVREYEEANVSFEKHQKILESKRQAIAELKKLLETIRKKEEPLQKMSEASPKKKPELSADNLSLVQQWMDCSIESKKELYEFLAGEIREKTESFEREARMQVHTDFQLASFWLLKYESFTQELDLLLRKTFDEWASKKREISVLNKYRKFNVEKIKRLTRQVAQLEEIIGTDRKEKEAEMQREKEELRRRLAATRIQAHWRGTMVRKHLGPYKIEKKKKKAKKGKKKGKK